MTVPRFQWIISLACVASLLACGDDAPSPVAMVGGGQDGMNDPGDGGPLDQAVDACVPRPEECNGIDDDCDGLGDEDLDPPPADRTEGICGDFFKQCAVPDGWQEPDYRRSPDYQEVEDRCDGFDNDCDGTTDENLSPPEASLVAGVCVGALQVCNGVRGYADPQFGDIMGYEATETTCDALDNDCDGTADEGLAGCMP